MLSTRSAFAVVALGIGTWSAQVNSGQSGNERKTVSVNGVSRSYLLHVPPQHDAQKPLPLVIVLHGGGGNAGNAERMSGFSAKADREGFLVAYPNGSGPLREMLLTWNSGNCCGLAARRNVDDVAFIRAMIARIEKDMRVDAKRIYATGISNGGMMSYKLGCELADKLAAIAPVAGALNVEKCEPSVPVSVVAVHGMADKHVLFEGGNLKCRPTARRAWTSP